MKRLCFLVLMVLGIMLGICCQSTLAAENSITCTVGPAVPALEYERAVTHSTTASLYWGQFEFLTDDVSNEYGIEIRNYLKGKTIGGAYVGLGYIHIDMHGDFIWANFDDADGAGPLLSVGYKKATASGFTYEAAIIGIYAAGASEMIPSARLAIGYSW